jgi:anti-sigma B factor antagonist
MMKQETDQVGNVMILRLNGRFDAAQANGPKSWLEQATAVAPAHVVVNLEQVNFVDSTALATLVQGMKRARQQGGDVYLAQMQPPVRMVFELTRLDKAFAIFPSEAEAVQALT